LFDGCVKAAIVFPCTFLGYFYCFGEGISAMGCVYTLGGFNFIFWGISLGIKRRMTEIRKNYFLLFAKYLKRYSFFAFAFKVCKKC
jgi:hypothetical protein